jgi:hypothetical protein
MQTIFRSFCTCSLEVIAIAFPRGCEERPALARDGRDFVRILFVGAVDETDSAGACLFVWLSP